jgi:hypothetical protein
MILSFDTLFNSQLMILESLLKRSLLSLAVASLFSLCIASQNGTLCNSSQHRQRHQWRWHSLPRNLLHRIVPSSPSIPFQSREATSRVCGRRCNGIMSRIQDGTATRSWIMGTHTVREKFTFWRDMVREHLSRRSMRYPIPPVHIFLGPES